MIDRSTIDRVIDRAEIVDVVSDFVTLHRKGKDYVGLCPFHDDTRPSFSVSPSRNICKCFACGEGGNPLTFIMKHEHLSFPEAIKYLGRKYGIPVEDKEITPEQLEHKNKREELRSANTFAKDAFVMSLHQDAEGRRIGLSYFRERGLKDETIKEFELGYSPASATFLVQKAQAAGMSLDSLEEVGLVFKTQRGDYIDRYRDRVIYPIHSISGNVVGFGGRILVKKENTGKYINSPASILYDKSRELYGLYHAKNALSKKDKCLVVEGYMDVLSMYQKGVKNVVASSGTALTHEQVQMIKRYTSNLTLIFDSDAAGIKAALKGLDVGLEKSMNVQVVLLPDGEDPDSFAQAHSLEAIEEYVQQHEVDGLFFKAETLAKELGDTPQAQAEIVQHLAESMAYIPEQLTREIYVGNMAPHLGVTAEALSRKVEELYRQKIQDRYKTREREQQRAQRLQAEKQKDVEVGTGAKGEQEQQAPQPQAPSTKKRIKNPVNLFEEDLLEYIIKEGMLVLEDFQKSDGTMGGNVIEAINDQTLDLRATGDLSSTFQQILDELMEELSQNPRLNPERYLTWHENEIITYYSNKKLMEDYTLSPMHSKFEEEEKKPEQVSYRLMQVIMSYKYDRVLQNISKVLGEIYTLADSDSKETNKEEEALLTKYAQLCEIKNKLAKMLGERIINPYGRVFRDE